MRFKFKSILPLILSILLVASSLMTTLARAEEFVISGNGDGSDNQIIVTDTSTTNITQASSADVTNTVDTGATTGENQVNSNTGDVSVTTGDVHEDVVIENSLNSSSVETPCCPSDTTLEVSGNGSNSQNTIDLTTNDTNTIEVNQIANITNNVAGSANTGDNQANSNGGNVTIETGSIWANSTIKNGPVNFYSVTSGIGGGNLFAGISGNGSGSANNILASFGFGNNVYVNNDFDVNNDVSWDLNTGRNTANGNTGDISIKTGDIFLNVLIENIANLGKVVVDCCDEPEGPDDPGEPSCDPCGPGEGGEETSPPSGSGGGGGSSSSAGSSAAGGPSILGLSDTSSPGAQALLFLVGLAMIAGGLALTYKELNVKEKISPARAKNR